MRYRPRPRDFIDAEFTLLWWAFGFHIDPEELMCSIGPFHPHWSWSG